MELFLTPKYVSSIVYLIGLAAAIGYLGFLPKKSRETKLILALLIAWFLGMSISTAYEVTHLQIIRSGAALTENLFLNYLSITGYFVFEIILGLFLYRVGFEFARIEEKVFRILSAVAVLYVSFSYVRHAGDLTNIVGVARLVIMATVVWGSWLVIVAARKLYVAYARGHEYRSKRLVLVATLTTIAALIFMVANSYLERIWPFSAESRGIVPLLMAVLVAGFLIIGYLLYGDEEHTLLVKLVGFLMIAYVAIFVVVVPVLRNEVSLRSEFVGADENHSLVFQPDSSGGYIVSEVSDVWLQSEGDTIILQDDEAEEVHSLFSIPFFGQSYDSVWLGTNGSMSFGEHIDIDGTYSEGLSIFGDIPSILPFYSDLVMAGLDSRILASASSDRFLATWNRISIYDLHESTLTMQVAVYPDGRIEINYGDFTTIPLLNYAGISGGGDAEPITFSAEEYRGGPGQPLFEHADNRLKYRRAVSPAVIPVAWIGVIGLLLILVGGTTFYKVGILNPLKRVLVGLEAVEKGDLDAEISILEKNELGALSDYFNRMTKSLREYSNKMEEMVAQRTSDLDKTIADLRSTQAQLVEQEKLASLGSLTAGIAHEIKNPLNFVNNFAEVSMELMDELSEAQTAGDSDRVASILDDLRGNAEQIEKHGKRADAIVRSMMQHAKGGVSEREDVDLNAFLEEYANLAWHGMRARDYGFQAEVVRDFDPEVGTVTLMPQELGRVVLNLFNNAFDAVRDQEGSKVTIRTKALPDAVEISVSDNGPGIPEDILEKIFEPFFTTKATGEGTGLGLSLSYDIVTKGHRGSMTAESKPGSGATFRMTLPT